MKNILKRFIIKELYFCSLRILICNTNGKLNQDIFEIFLFLVKNANKLKILLLQSNLPYFFYSSKKIKLPSVMCNEDF